MKAVAVIGANYGDEGKGLVTDYLVAQNEADVVVRFSGGAQAGHTVVTPEGVRHVHSHFGSGTLQGVPTFLSQDFIVHPIGFVAERTKLLPHVLPQVYVDPRASVATPYDLMLNRAIERQRGTTRHGSCGLGVNETVKRTQAGFGLTVADLVQPDLEALLSSIRHIYVPTRMAQLGLHAAPPECNSAAVLEQWLRDCAVFVQHSTQRAWGPHWKSVVFEGAQGLRLDTHAPDFPYVTNANTGLTNVLKMLGASDRLDVYYTTRCYMTRHGPGPLQHELPGLVPYRLVHDDTNISNAWQGALRFGWFDLDEFQSHVLRDLSQCEDSIAAGWITPKVVVTCLDQLGTEYVRYYHYGRELRQSAEVFVRTLINSVGAAAGLAVFGPTRANVVPFGQLVLV